ncbi:MAG TPA: flagellar basal body-associated FliL family protein [Alphaproteobacteria bacterium]|nr:flagellar basal body-associated FliL family protein [Alphaproteobacteria bacterium]
MADDKEKKEDAKDEAKAEGAAEGAEGGEGGEAAEGGKKKLSKKMMIIMAAGALVVLLGGGGAAFFFLHKSGGDDAAKTAAAAAGASGDQQGHPVYFPLGDLLVNLSGEGKHPNFLKVKISLELADEKDVPLMDAIKPRIVDNFQVYLRELRIGDLRGSAGMYRLREELLMRVTEAAQPVRVRDVLFQEMLVQ